MHEGILRGLAAEFPDAQLRLVDEAIEGIVRSGDSYLSVTLRPVPFAEIFVQTRKLDGFEIAIKWQREHAAFERAFDVSSNDDVLVEHWLDDVSRSALLASKYVYEGFVEMEGMLSTGVRTWTYELREDRLVAFKGGAEAGPKRLAVALSTACTLAARSQRWGLAYRELARTIGAHARSDVELGGPPIITVERHAMEIAVALDRSPKLRTVVSARRVGVDGETLSLAMRKMAVPDGKKREAIGDYAVRSSDASIVARVDEPAKRLIEIAKPAAAIIDTTSIEVIFDGAPTIRERIDAAIELAARWAVDVPTSSGPYR